MRLTTVVFDLGASLSIGTRAIYRQLFDDADEMKSFLCGGNDRGVERAPDAGRSWGEAVELLVSEHLERRWLIEASTVGAEMRESRLRP